MNLRIDLVKAHGDLELEYIQLQVKADCNIQDYLLLDSTYDDEGMLSNLLPHCFQFPNLKVQRGDFIRLYTRSGEYEAVRNKKQTQTHHLYWGLEESVWNQDGDCATVILCAGYDIKGV